MDIYTKLNYSPFSNSDLKEIAENYFQECKKASVDNPSLLPFYNSRIHYDFPRDALFQNVLVIDIGGSHLRLAWMKKDNLEVLQDIKVHSVEQFNADVDEFVSFVGGHISAYLGSGTIECEAVGISFSFDFDAIQNGENIDIDRSGVRYGDNWKKGYTIKDSNINISKKLRNYLAKNKNITFKRWVGVNDVNALHLNSKNALCAVIVGTGYNISVIGPSQQIFNTESKNFNTDLIRSNIPLPLIDVLEDIRLQDIGRYEAQRGAVNEMQIAAYHMPSIFLKSLELLGIQDDKIVKIVHKLKAEIISLFFASDIHTVSKRIGYEIEESQFHTYREISNAIMERSASLVAAELVGAMKFSRESFETNEKIVIADGAIFQKTLGYRELVQSYMGQIINDSSIVIKCVDDSGLKGAGVSVFTKSV